MAALPFRSTVPAFDADVFAQINPGPDRTETIRVAARFLSASNSRPTLYDIDALREVMGGGRLSQYARTASDTIDLKHEHALQQAQTTRSEPHKKEMDSARQTKRIGQKNKKDDQCDFKILPLDVEHDLSHKTKANTNARFNKSNQKSKDTKNTKRQSQSQTDRHRDISRLQPGLKVSLPSASPQSQPQPPPQPRSNRKQGLLQGGLAPQDYEMQLRLIELNNKARGIQDTSKPYWQSQRPLTRPPNPADTKGRIPVVSNGQISHSTEASDRPGFNFDGENALENFDFDSFLNAGEDSNDGTWTFNFSDHEVARPSDTPGQEVVNTKYTISEDDTVPESERQSRWLMALQPPQKVLPAAPRDWRR
ncbi:hypothetical protein C7974DRAFT_416008 [Boeremia exigua]|uniref:uncharacterized protein n=1 Tax=Boeremia exigua TaxID=749465 RepID=UPI001E8DFF1B|nr:uncharacterized protein C7974DRAFT_416008 [Boeremia exigua]KAH6618647.1 hypothetical protein C7974DRAFT_416008 [Boeremia exigua]